MDSLLIVVVGFFIVLIVSRILSLVLRQYEKRLKESFRFLGVLSLGKIPNDNVPAVDIRNHLKLTNIPEDFTKKKSA